MQKKCKRTLLSLILSMMLIVAMAFNMTACSDNESETPNTEQDSKSDVVENNSQEEQNVLGEGATVFNFVVVDSEGKESTFEIHTDKTVVGEALLELGLIAGDSAEYGLYVKTVNGITVDFDTDGKYWAFYINGEYAMTGVDVTPIVEGEEYSFKVE